VNDHLPSCEASWCGLTLRITAPRPGLIGVKTDSQPNWARDLVLLLRTWHRFARCTGVAPTLIKHQQIACDALGFQWLTGHHPRALVRVLRQELDRTDDRERLLGFARSWLYEHRLIIVHERLLRSMIAVARRAHEAQLARRIDHAVEPGLVMRWRACSPTSPWPGTRTPDTVSVQEVTEFGVAN
jgi:hypothetical protein